MTNFRFSLPFILIALLHMTAVAQDWDVRRVSEKDKSPYVSRIIKYWPAPGQFVNETGIGAPEAAESIVGGVQGMVSLGNFGGYIVVGFDHTIWNDPDNPYGVDFTVVGNAVANSSEPGIVMVMADKNGNGLPDDTWYELKGSSYAHSATTYNYTITYTNPLSDKAAEIPWTDNKGNSGTLKTIPEHRQPYYPSSIGFTDYPQDKVSFTGTLVDLGIDANNPSFIKISPLPYGYADNLPFRHGSFPYLPDNPLTPDVLEGNGGNAFDIDWAIDGEGNSVNLEGIDFIKIYTAVNVSAGWLGEISTEVCGVIDVSPDDVLSAPTTENKPDIKIYPNPVSDFIRIQSENGNPLTHVEIWNIAGRLVYTQSSINSSGLSVTVRDYPSGIYLVRVTQGRRQITMKIVVGVFSGGVN